MLCGLLSLCLAANAPLASPAQADQHNRAIAGDDADPDEAEEPASSGLNYKVEISGISNENLKTLIESSSQLVALSNRPPASIGSLKRRADEDMKRINTALRSEGYYKAEVAYTIEDTKDPMLVQINIEPGPRTHLKVFDITYLGDTQPPENSRPTLAELGLRLGMTAKAPAILAAEQQIIVYLKDRGFPNAAIGERKTFVDVATDTMTVKLQVESGRFANFGPTTISGLDDVKEDYIDSLITWQEGDPYDQRLIETTRRALLETGLFSAVRIVPRQGIESDGALPIEIAATEGPLRTIGFGAGYSSDIGINGEIFWRHRNFFGRNEILQTGLSLSPIEQSVEADFRKPHFLRPDQALLARASFGREDTEAFDRVGIDSYIGLEREWSELWTFNAGTSLEYETIKDDTGRRQFLILGLPVSGHRDDTDNPLNPSRGTRLDIALTPYGAREDSIFTFFKTEIGGSAYYAIDAEKRYILAARTKVGSIVGRATRNLPADKRFYAGGGGSIRGYGFQLVGPLDADGDPLGGRSLLEFSGELRIKVTEDIGLVPFVDGGTVFDAPYPDFQEKILWAAGLGVRYFTGVGPVRLDVAIPINRRRGVDDAFQFYVSIGQAF